MSKRLVVCCDGTWNRPEELEQGVPAPTNVSKLALAVASEDPAGTPQLLFYQQGVGTRRFERIRGGAFGYGLSRNVRDCYSFVVENYEPGDELYLFGFSRGAFTARSTAGFVRNCGILRPEHVGRINDAYRLYRARDPARHPNGLEARLFRRMYSRADSENEIKFIGVWDTVGSLGIPIDGVRVPFITRLWSFHDVTLSSHVRFAYQALAIDEQRLPFKPTLWRQQDDAKDQILEQVWFAGVHSDVGGGYPDPALAEISMLWIAQRARDTGLNLDPDHFKLTSPPLDIDARALGVQIAPDAIGPIHESRKGFYLLFPRYRRPLRADGAKVASSAVRRRHEKPDYAPPNLDDFLPSAGPPADVP
jgi:uncharacterized protein (DUF2235 family)